jgi:hypothetical protein
MTLENTQKKRLKYKESYHLIYETVIGLRQGDSLSTLLFNLCMEKTIRNVKNKSGRNTEIMGEKIENVESFKYLGSLVTDLNEMETEIKSRLAAGNKSYHAPLTANIKKKSLYPSQLKFVFTKHL